MGLDDYKYTLVEVKLLHFTENYLKIFVTSFEQNCKLTQLMITLKLYVLVFLKLPIEKCLHIFS